MNTQRNNNEEYTVTYCNWNSNVEVARYFDTYEEAYSFATTNVTNQKFSVNVYEGSTCVWCSFTNS